jgi:hypothetical protein
MISTSISHIALNHVEVIANLAYLIGIESEHPETVKAHAADLEKEAITLGQFLRSVTRELKESGC